MNKNIENEMINNTTAQEEEAMMNNAEVQVDWKQIFAGAISELAKYPLGIDHIHSDATPGWYYYITAESLVPNYPLLMMHYRGPLFAVIPVEDYQKLEEGADPIEYINNAHWNYGYYWGGGSMIGGAFWQPLEEQVGINDTEKVSRYLNILSCRTHRHSSGYMPREEDCMRCRLENCPFSQFKNEGTSWEEEVQEHDYRTDMFKAFAERAKSELGIKLRGLTSYSGENALVIPITYEKEECTLYLPVTLLNDILYHPGDRDWKQIANSMRFELGVSMKDDRLILGDELTVPASEFCRNFWSSFGIIDKWEIASARKEMYEAEETLKKAEAKVKEATGALEQAKSEARNATMAFKYAESKVKELERNYDSGKTCAEGDEEGEKTFLERVKDAYHYILRK